MKKAKESELHMNPPDGDKKVLMHSCCAPCVGPLMEQLQAEGVELTIYFYNPNIHPQKEYLIRKEENIRYAKKMNIPFIDADYDPEYWFDLTKGHEDDPERGERCSMCFDMRFVKTADYASKNGFKVISSSLGISRWKDFDQVTQSGVKAAALFPGITYWQRNWRKRGGSQRMIDLAKEESFYQQQYCGCAYSLRDTNKWRSAKGGNPVRIGKDFYSFKKNSGQQTA